MWLNFLSKLNTVFAEDKNEWAEVLTNLREIYGNKPRICWYASSGLDFSPIVRIHTPFIYHPNHSIMLMSDYDKELIDLMKSAYDTLGQGPISTALKSNYAGIGEIVQMIPLSLWSVDEIAGFESYNFSLHSIGNYVSDKQWHVIFLLVDTQYGEIPVFFIAAENLLILEEIFNKYQIGLETFFAIRVGGKSGSWDATHDFETGKLPNRIKTIPHSLRPKFWGSDNHLKLPSFFTKIEEATVPGMGFEDGCQFFRTNY